MTDVSTKPTAPAKEATPAQPTTLRAHLKELTDLYPDATDEELTRLMTDRVRFNPVLEREAVAYWLNRNIRGVRPKTPEQLRQEQAARDAARERAARSTRSIVDEYAKHVTLNFIMPNGKTLRDTTREEAEVFFGAGLTVTNLVPRGSTFGDVFKTDDDLQKALAA